MQRTTLIALTIALSFGTMPLAAAESEYSPGANGNTGLSPKGDMEAAKKSQGGGMNRESDSPSSSRNQTKTGGPSGGQPGKS